MYNHHIQKTNIARRFGCQYFQGTEQLILDMGSSDMAPSHYHDLGNY